MKAAPCKNCPNRHVGCHSQCDDYKDWRAERDKVLEIKRLENSAIPDFNIKAMEKQWRQMKNGFKRRSYGTN